jgi:hypothetical protein
VLGKKLEDFRRRSIESCQTLVNTLVRPSGLFKDVMAEPIS